MCQSVEIIYQGCSLGDTPYSVVVKKKVTVADIWMNAHLNLFWRVAIHFLLSHLSGYYKD